MWEFLGATRCNLCPRLILLRIEEGSRVLCVRSNPLKGESGSYHRFLIPLSFCFIFFSISIFFVYLFLYLILQFYFTCYDVHNFVLWFCYGFLNDQNFVARNYICRKAARVSWMTKILLLEITPTFRYYLFVGSV